MDRPRPGAIREDLDVLLAPHRFEPEYSGPPFVSGGSAGSPLIVAYMLVRGGEAVNDSAVPIRAYTASGGRFRFCCAAGGDPDGYGLFVKRADFARTRGEIGPGERLTN